MVVAVSEESVGGFLRSGRDERIAAVAAAPVAADMPAMMARVVLDIVSDCRLVFLEKQQIATTYILTTTRYTQSSGPFTIRHWARDTRS